MNEADATVTTVCCSCLRELVVPVAIFERRTEVACPDVDMTCPPLWVSQSTLT